MTSVSFWSLGVQVSFLQVWGQSSNFFKIWPLHDLWPQMTNANSTQSFPLRPNFSRKAEVNTLIRSKDTVSGWMDGRMDRHCKNSMPSTYGGGIKIFQSVWPISHSAILLGFKNNRSRSDDLSNMDRLNTIWESTEPEYSSIGLQRWAICRGSYLVSYHFKHRINWWIYAYWYHFKEGHAS
jgi:hypothetical protein